MEYPRPLERNRIMPSKFQNSRDLRLDAKFTIGNEAANAITVEVQLVDRDNGNTVAEVVPLDWYISSDASGTAFSSAPNSGAAIAGGGSSGALQEYTDNVAGMLLTNASGAAALTLTHSGTGTFYLALKMPDGKVSVSDAITFAA